MNASLKRNLGLTSAALLCSATALAQDAQPPATQGQIFSATLAPVNNSGVTGQAWAVLGTDGQAVAIVTAQGVEPGQTHPQHVHPGSGGDGSASGCPTLQADADGNFLISGAEAEAAIGAPILALEPFPQGQDGSYVFVQTYTLGDVQPEPAQDQTQDQDQAQDQTGDQSPDQTQTQQVTQEQLQDLAGRLLVVHGMNVAGSYQEDVPVACGQFQSMSTPAAPGGTAGTGGTGTDGTDDTADTMGDTDDQA